MSTTTAPPVATAIEQALARAHTAAQAKRFGEAAGICNDLLAAAPESAAALALLGMISAQTGNLERGIAYLERALKLQTGVARWCANLSALYRMAYRTQDALRVGQQAIQLDPQNADHLISLSLVFTDLDDRERANACLLRALGLRPDHAEGHLALGQNLLATGEFTPGWIEYEWRNQTEAAKGTLPAMTSAAWNGMRIQNGRLLMVGDQGYGDTIQFARYIPLIADRCEELILGCSAEMGPLLEKLPGVKQFCHRWTDIPSHAVHCRLSSVPRLVHTTLDTIPAEIPYLFADQRRIAVWGQRLNATLPQRTPRIGLAWTGRPTHPNDRRRSMPLARLTPLAKAGTASFVSLQKPFASSDQPAVVQFPDLVDTAADLTDFGETAAVIANLDLIITVDTAVAHLAGAMGRPVWVMLPKTSDWRWLLDRNDSPWYPTVRLFRQQTPGAWDPIVAAVSNALAQELQSAGADRALSLS